MNISEQNKHEAEKLIEWYFPDAYPFSAGSGYLTGDMDEDSQRRFACRIAIKDRQSVLEYATKKREKYNRYHDNIDIDILKEITNLTEQIEYLKSKL